MDVAWFDDDVAVSVQMGLIMASGLPGGQQGPVALRGARLGPWPARVAGAALHINSRLPIGACHASSVAGRTSPTPAAAPMQRTADGGATWANISVPSGVDPVGGPYYELKSNTQLWSVVALGPTDGLVCGATSQWNSSGGACTNIYRTTDAGGWLAGCVANKL